jgi:hypothetical protein
MQVYWQCVNRNCGLTALSTPKERDLENRMCVCGSPMEKREHSVVFSYLNFLREEPETEPAERTRKEQWP